MAANPGHIASHEAAHAVIQWVVGWESELQHIQMRRIEGGATDGGMEATPPVLHTSAVTRSRLLVLFAGHVAARVRFGSGLDDFEDDYTRAVVAIRRFLKVPSLKRIGRSIKLEDPVADKLKQDAIDMTERIVTNERVARTIDAVSMLLMDAAADDNGLCIVQGKEIIEVCERECGVAMKQNNLWADWINASDESGGTK